MLFGSHSVCYVTFFQKQAPFQNRWILYVSQGRDQISAVKKYIHFPFIRMVILN